MTANPLRHIRNPLPSDFFKNLALLVAAGTGIVSIVLHLCNGILTTAALRKPPPRLVELASGRTIETQPVGSLERQPEAIDRFTREVMGLLFTWTGQTLSSEGEVIPDEGITIGRSVRAPRLTTPAWQASLALAPRLQQPMQTKIAELIPSGVFGRGDQVILNITHLAPPREDPERPGHWTQTMVAHLVHFHNGQVTEPVAFNRRIYLRAVDPPVQPPVELSHIEQAIREVRGSGLEIYEIEEIH